MLLKKIKNLKVPKLIYAGGFFIPFAVLLIIVVGYSGWQITYQPKYSCNICHNIQPYVESYYSSDNLDHVHQDANVGCKDCHKANLTEMAGEGFKYVTGNFQDPMRETKLSKEICLTCHRSYQVVSAKTEDLEPNPHASPHYEEAECSLCHKSHRDSVLLCDQCHQYDMETS